MSALRRLVLSAALAFGLLGGAVPVTTVLAASCGGSAAACDHTSPQTTGCSADASTQRTVYIVDENWPYGNIGKVELRYSPSCHTAWSRVWILEASQYSTDEWVTRQQDGVSDHRYDSIYQGQSAYSHQLYVRGKSARACAYISNGTVAAGQACTSYVAFP